MRQRSFDAACLPKLVLFCSAGLPKYNQQVKVVVISDVGANWQAVFIPLGTLTAIFFFASLWLDFSLRHTYRQVEALCGFLEGVSSSSKLQLVALPRMAACCGEPYVAC